MNFSFILRITVCCALIAFTSCSKVDITNEEAVYKDIQGSWVGYEISDSLIRHVKLNISDNSFEGWIHTSKSMEEPEWNNKPDETGSISISSVLVNSINKNKYRKINFMISGGCCGDNSCVAKTLSKFINYSDGKGLCLSVPGKMAKK